MYRLQGEMMRSYMQLDKYGFFAGYFFCTGEDVLATAIMIGVSVHTTKEDVGIISIVKKNKSCVQGR